LTVFSQVQLDVVANNNIKDRKITRHETRFGITSFIYRARRPFHPGRLVDLLLDPYFSKMEIEDEDEEDKLSEEEKVIWLQKIQKEAAAKQVKRTAIMGQLLRSKGFIWIATSHDIIGSWQQAGNVTRLEAESAWMCETREMWEDTPSAELILQDMKQPNGVEWKYSDRRQELVFIGQGLKHETIQKILDKCLLDDKEMKMGPEKWGEAFADVDKIQLTLDFGDDEEGEEEEEEENDEDEGENDDAEEKELSDGSESPPVKKKKKSH
jgi:G3E family GTPase